MLHPLRALGRRGAHTPTTAPAAPGSPAPARVPLSKWRARLTVVGAIALGPFAPVLLINKQNRQAFAAWFNKPAGPDAGLFSRFVHSKTGKVMMTLGAAYVASRGVGLAIPDHEEKGVTPTPGYVAPSGDDCKVTENWGKEQAQTALTQTNGDPVAAGQKVVQLIVESKTHPISDCTQDQVKAAEDAAALYLSTTDHIAATTTAPPTTAAPATTAAPTTDGTTTGKVADVTEFCVDGKIVTVGTPSAAVPEAYKSGKPCNVPVGKTQRVVADDVVIDIDGR